MRWAFNYRTDFSENWFVLEAENGMQHFFRIKFRGTSNLIGNFDRDVSFRMASCGSSIGCWQSFSILLHSASLCPVFPWLFFFLMATRWSDNEGEAVEWKPFMELWWQNIPSFLNISVWNCCTVHTGQTNMGRCYLGRYFNDIIKSYLEVWMHYSLTGRERC